jgi:hypothetical protein
MIRTIAIAIGVAALAATAALPQNHAPLAPRAAASPAPALALLSNRQGGTLVRIDASLRTLAGRRLAVGPYMRGWSFSRDGSRLALGTDETARLAFVDARRLRVLGRMELAPAGAVAGTAWLGPRLLLAVVVGSEGTLEVVSVDPVARRVLSRTRLDGSLLRWVRTADGFALLLGPPDAIGAARLAVVLPSGAVDVVTLDRVLGGWGSHDDEGEPVAVRLPGLAVDPDGRRAYVVPSGAELAEVDLDSLGVRYHQLSEPVSLLGRLGAWLQPAAHAKRAEGPIRSARWLGSGVIAVSGMDYATSKSGEMSMTPAGLRLVDTRTWTVRTVDARVQDVQLTGELLLATGAAWQGGVATRAIGLVAYGLDGRQRFHLYAGRSVYVWHADARRGYVHLGGNAFEVVDLASGKVVGRRSTMPAVLTPGGPGSFG